ncbi:hypothetical protein C2L64_47560 [Paraburkholderia hospita]|uniref:DNA (cytosine-5-)-methyltransferase n=1 Tax=Paraburkholderia hospita TaxID=169430 RepID=A0AAN1JMY7_9BURK|nr:hypothetical protein C2L64_47560 [Paraburkholderia hospita]
MDHQHVAREQQGVNQLCLALGLINECLGFHGCTSASAPRARIAPPVFDTQAYTQFGNSVVVPVTKPSRSWRARDFLRCAQQRQRVIYFSLRDSSNG